MSLEQACSSIFYYRTACNSFCKTFLESGGKAVVTFALDTEYLPTVSQAVLTYSVARLYYLGTSKRVYSSTSKSTSSLDM
jgi:hypothetical protein